MQQTLIRIYGVLISAVFAIVFSAQILGFFGLYHALFAIPITLIVFVAATIMYHRFGTAWFETLSPQKTRSALLRNSILFVCLLIVLSVFVQRMILWDQSTLGQSVSADFAGYHSIKALQLYREGSVWNLAIPYGQYPFGYESLIAFGMFLTRDIRITGSVHALTFVLFWLTIALLIVRYGQLSIDTSLLLALALCFVPIVFPQLLNLGKNDTFLSLTVLMALLHAPVGDEHFHPIGLAFATMLSLAIKATGLYILFYLWGLVMLNWGLHFTRKTWRDYLHPLVFVLVIAVMFPGGLWVIRNYLVLGEVFTSEITSFFQTSIIANLSNPALYRSPSSNLLLIGIVLLLVAAMVSIFHPRLRCHMTGALLVIAFTFAVTPLSAFLTSNNLDYLDVQWRFVLHGIIMLWVILITVLAPIIRCLFTQASSHIIFTRFASLGIVLASIGIIFVIGFDDLFSYDAHQWDRMLDPTLQENSVYDELENLESGTMYIENINWFAATMRNPNLTITELRYPLGHADVYPMPDLDYIAFSGHADPTASFYQADEWQEIFEHPTGRIFQRIP